MIDQTTTTTTVQFTSETIDTEAEETRLGWESGAIGDCGIVTINPEHLKVKK